MSNSANLAGVLLLSAALGPCSGSEFSERFVEACGNQTNMDQAICECLADRGETELSDNAKTMLLATIEGNEEVAREMRSELSMADAMQAGLFMTEAGSCAAELGGARTP